MSEEKKESKVESKPSEDSQLSQSSTDSKIIEFLATKVPLMFNDKKTLKQMKKGGSPMRIMNRAEVQAMWIERKKSLTKLLAGLKAE